MQPAVIINEKDNSRFEQCPEDSILRAALRAGLGLAYECNSGGCGACKFELVSGDIETLWSQATGLTARDRKRGRHLACQCQAKGPVTIKASTAAEYVPRIVPKRHQATLMGITDITHDIREFRFVTDGEAQFLAGQYAMLDLPNVGSARAYSMSNTANAKHEWHFQIRRVTNGKATAMLFDELAIGTKIGLDAPYGLAYLRTDAERDLVCVAGGSGLAPMISIARGAAQAGLLQTRHLHFFYGARRPKDVCGQVLLADLQEFGTHIHYHPVVSDATLDPWQGATGFVHHAIAPTLAKALPNFEFYFAGPPPMTQALQEMLMLEHQVPFEQIHFDRFF
jgi:toluene monooxygenase electron transfer component